MIATRQTNRAADVTLRRIDELTDLERAAWVRLAETVPAFDGPYFRPEFTEHVAAVRDDVCVAVLDVEGRPVGFLPFQKSGRVGRPVGGRLSDFHAVIVEPGVEWTVARLMHGCGLRTFHFDHLLASQGEFVPHHWEREGSPYMDLSRGFDAYERERKAAKSGDVKETLRRERKLGREHEVRFEWKADDAALDRLIAWKTEQYRRTDKTEVFSFPWTVALVRRLLQVDEPGFGGVLSGMSVDGELVAAHFGIRSRNVLHYWFPAFGDRCEKFSPGLVLQLKIARACAERGLTRIDLGKGNERYKVQFASGAIEMAAGVVDGSAMTGFVRRNWHRTKDWVKASPLAGAARVPARIVRSLRERGEFA
jgi:CelD/BcsL family acetyltransferase involved in cellulose biosynthesis